MPPEGGKEHALERSRGVACDTRQNSILTGLSEPVIEYASRAFDRCATRPSGLGKCHWWSVLVQAFELAELLRNGLVHEERQRTYGGVQALN